MDNTENVRSATELWTLKCFLLCDVNVTLIVVVIVFLKNSSIKAFPFSLHKNQADFFLIRWYNILSQLSTDPRMDEVWVSPPPQSPPYSQIMSPGAVSRPESHCPPVASGSPNTSRHLSESGATFQLPSPVSRRPMEETGSQALRLLLLRFRTRMAF